MELSSVVSKLVWPLFASLTLGLAPFQPMPHFFEKIQWLITGHPFAPIDIFDLFLHGLPWVWLVVALGSVLGSLGTGRPKELEKEPRKA